MCVKPELTNSTYQQPNNMGSIPPQSRLLQNWGYEVRLKSSLLETQTIKADELLAEKQPSQTITVFATERTIMLKTYLTSFFSGLTSSHQIFTKAFFLK